MFFVFVGCFVTTVCRPAVLLPITVFVPKGTISFLHNGWQISRLGRQTSKQIFFSLCAAPKIPSALFDDWRQGEVYLTGRLPTPHLELRLSTCPPPHSKRSLTQTLESAKNRSPSLFLSTYAMFCHLFPQWSIMQRI